MQFLVFDISPTQHDSEISHEKTSILAYIVSHKVKRNKHLIRPEHDFAKFYLSDWIFLSEMRICEF